MLLSTLLTLCIAAQQPADVPFEFELPQGYSDFQALDAGTWRAARLDGQASYTLRHFQLDALGADPNAIAEDLKQRQWIPLGSQLELEIEPWVGQVDRYPGAGWVVHYEAEREMTILQRLTVCGDRLTMLEWEGPRAAQEDTRQRFDGFRLPSLWIPPPPPDRDPHRGLGEIELARPFPGRLEVEVRIPPFSFAEQVEVEMLYIPSQPLDPGDFRWQLPLGAEAIELESDTEDGRRVRYRLPVDGARDYGSAYGLHRVGAQSISAVDALWLAVPMFLLEQAVPYRSPAWSLRVLHPVHLKAVSSALARRDYDEELQAAISTFEPVPADRSWPFFLLSGYRAEQSDGLDWQLRVDCKAKLVHDSARELQQLRQALAAWLPGGDPAWSMISFPGVGDRVLPQLLVLDEDRDWFQAPVDAELDGLPRRASLARYLCQDRFGSQLKGLGSAKLFLESSLAEYAAWRLLEAAGHEEEAASMAALWRARELHAGPLPMPLSLLSEGDLLGPRRLLSAGPLLWQEIERQASRPVLDAVLQQKLTSASTWTTADLEAALQQAAPDVDWQAFLDQRLYSRATASPAAPQK